MGTYAIVASALEHQTRRLSSVTLGMSYSLIVSSAIRWLAGPCFLRATDKEIINTKIGAPSKVGEVVFKKQPQSSRYMDS